MSWEIDYINYKNCVCENKGVKITAESDDWNRNRVWEEIICNSCKEIYKIVTYVEKKDGFIYERSGFISRKIEFPSILREEIQPHEKTEWEWICNNFELEFLKKIKKQIINEKNANRILNNEAKCFISQYKNAFKTQNLNLIKINLEKSIKKYTNYSKNYDLTIAERNLRIKEYNQIFAENLIKLEEIDKSMSLKQKIMHLNELCKINLYSSNTPLYWSIKTILIELETKSDMFLFSANLLEKKLHNSLNHLELEKYQSYTQYKLLEDLINIAYKINETKINVSEKIIKHNLNESVNTQFQILKELYSEEEMKIIRIMRDHLNHLVIDNTDQAKKMHKKIIDLAVKEDWIEIYDINFKKENLRNIKNVKDFFIEKNTSLANKSIKYSVIFNPLNSNSISENWIGFQIASKIIVINLNILNIKIADIIMKCLKKENFEIFIFFWVIFKVNNLL
ncbi:hypothetical protein [Mesoplasma coleopterae]|uniref:hypothetical protein n=1 Tax=Mesoplasma coleopterae TaxID=324078 RepID=UPI000D038A2E|nr:hypothetical protein [Mesoplasma coleopterae]AVN63227.1 hypothetical protein CG000_02940 [Mesoplasma coleopterae]